MLCVMCCVKKKFKKNLENKFNNKISQIFFQKKNSNKNFTQKFLYLKKNKKKIQNKQISTFFPHNICIVSHSSYHTPTLLPVEYDEYWCDKHNTGIW